MKLRERYKRLTLWNKIAFWGSIASVVGVVLTVYTIFNAPKPVMNEKWKSAFEELENKKSENENVIVSRNFRILKEKGATLTLGPCPSPNCFVFKIGEMFEEDGLLIQRIYLEGDGFGYKFGGKHLFESTNLILISGAQVCFDFAEGKAFVEISLDKNVILDIWTQNANIKFRVTDTDVSSLTINITLTENTQPPIPLPPRFNKEDNNGNS